MKEIDLNGSKIFSKLEKCDLDLLLQISTLKEFSRGEIINYENDMVHKIYFLLDGFIKIYKIDRFDNEVFLYTQKTGGLITTFGLTQKCTYFSNTECLEDSIVLCIQIELLQELIAKSQKLCIFFYEELSKKVDILKYVVSREMVFDGTAKVAYMLANQLNEFTSLRKQDAAYMLNIQPETLSRILTKFKREDIIDTNADGKIIVKNHNKLNAIFAQ